MKNKNLKIGALLLIVPGILLASHFSSPRVIANVVSSDGTKMCVVQELSGEIIGPFNSSFVYRKPNGKWGWFYYDHQDFLWTSSRFAVNEQTKLLTIYRNNAKAITFNWQTGTYTKWEKGVPERTINGGAQRWLSKDWMPGKSIKLMG